MKVSTAQAVKEASKKIDNQHQEVQRTDLLLLRAEENLVVENQDKEDREVLLDFLQGKESFLQK